MRAGILVMSVLAGWGPTPAGAESCTWIPGPDGEAQLALLWDNGPVPIEPAFEDYAFMLFDACDAWGLSADACKIFPMMGEINNAVATWCDGNAIIVYERRLSDRVGYAGAQAVMSHELGHHVCHHSAEGRVDLSRDREQELEADRFAGGTMRLLEFGRAEALSYLPLLSELPAGAHPGRDDRAIALAQGWDDPAGALDCATQ